MLAMNTRGQRLSHIFLLYVEEVLLFLQSFLEPLGLLCHPEC